MGIPGGVRVFLLSAWNPPVPAYVMLTIKETQLDLSSLDFDNGAFARLVCEDCNEPWTVVPIERRAISEGGEANFRVETDAVVIGFELYEGMCLKRGWADFANMKPPLVVKRRDNVSISWEKLSSAV